MRRKIEHLREKWQEEEAANDWNEAYKLLLKTHDTHAVKVSFGRWQVLPTAPMSFTLKPKEAQTMTQYHEGQEVEVATVARSNFGAWRKAKVVNPDWHMHLALPNSGAIEVEFPDGKRAVLDADHIRPARGGPRGAYGHGAKRPGVLTLMKRGFQAASRSAKQR